MPLTTDDGSLRRCDRRNVTASRGPIRMPSQSSLYSGLLPPRQRGSFALKSPSVTVKSRSGESSVAEAKNPVVRIQRIGTMRPLLARMARDRRHGRHRSRTASRSAADERGRVFAKGLAPLARIVGQAAHAHEPEWFTTAAGAGDPEAADDQRLEALRRRPLRGQRSIRLRFDGGDAALPFRTTAERAWRSPFPWPSHWRHRGAAAGNADSKPCGPEGGKRGIAAACSVAASRRPRPSNCCRSAFSRDLSRRSAFRHDLLPGNRGRRRLSGVTQRIFIAGSLMSQVLQWTQFCALIWNRRLPSGFWTISKTPAGQ